MKKNIILLSLCIALVVFSLMVGSRVGELAGADSQIEVVISEVQSDYEPWIDVMWAPPSGETESMLFSLQAALGAGFIGYFIGKKRNVSNSKSLCQKE